MKFYFFFLNLSLLCLLFTLNRVLALSTFNATTGIASAWLSSIAYCKSSVYSTYNYSGPNEGFVYTADFNDSVSGMQGE